MFKRLLPAALTLAMLAVPLQAAATDSTSVTVCAPGSSTNCQTIDNILVDTRSWGLRPISSVLSPALSLPQQFDASGNPLLECAQFAEGFSWGPVKLVDMQIAGEQAKSLLQPAPTCTQFCISHIRSILA